EAALQPNHGSERALRRRRSVKPGLPPTRAREENLDQILVVVVVDLRVDDIEADIEVWNRTPDRAAADLPYFEIRVAPRQCRHTEAHSKKTSGASGSNRRHRAVAQDELRGAVEGDARDVAIDRGADCRGPHVLVGSRYRPRRRQMQAAFDELRVARAA